MASDGKRGFLFSLFGSRTQKQQQEAADLDSRRRLEERIQQILAERIDVPQLITQEDHPALPAPAEVETEIELFPITASVFNRTGPIPTSFLPASVESSRAYAATHRL